MSMRKLKLSARQQAQLVTQHESQEHTIADLAEIFSVSRPTVYRVLERARNARTEKLGAPHSGGKPPAPLYARSLP